MTTNDEEIRAGIPRMDWEVLSRERIDARLERPLPDLMNLEALLANCRDRQYRLYGVYPETMAPAIRAAYLRDMVLALHSEADECLRTLVWKPWASKNLGEYVGSVPDRAAEVIDVLLFTMNIALALGVGPDDLAAAFQAKVPVVDARITDRSYTG